MGSGMFLVQRIVMSQENIVIDLSVCGVCKIIVRDMYLFKRIFFLKIKYFILFNMILFFFVVPSQLLISEKKATCIGNIYTWRCLPFIM